MEIEFKKILTKTDIEKRLSVPTVNKKCFLNFRGQHKVEFKVKDKNSKVWSFGCSTRKNKGYPKPVLSKGWLQFVRCWKLAIDDGVILYRKQDEAGKWPYRIEVIKRATQRSSVLSPLVQNHDADRTMAIASYSNVEEEPTITSHILDQASCSNIEEELTTTSQSTDQAITYDLTEGIHYHPVTDRVGLKFEFISPEPRIKIREPKFIDFFELGSKEQGKEQTSIPTPNHMVKSPITSSRTPYFKFL
ncbi:hypothetical protein CRYUN_Cryun06bG0010500 [Craigia yunnanensis]